MLKRRVLSISIFLILLWLESAVSSVVAQNKPVAGDWVRGIVTDSLGQYIDSVSVMELNVAGDTLKQVPTDSKGVFNFMLINPKDSIRFSKRAYRDTVVSINRLYYQISLRDKEIEPEPEPESKLEPEPDLSDMVPAFDASNDVFIVCDYEESLIEVVPDSFICGYTFSPYGYKPYGIFLQGDSSGYQAILNYYKYNRDKVDDVMSSATLDINNWQAKGLIEAAKHDIDRARVYQKGPKVDFTRDFNVVKVIMDGKAAEHWHGIVLSMAWFDLYDDFKYELGPEPKPNANRWEVTPYYNPSETYNEPCHWVASSGWDDLVACIYSGDYIFGAVFADCWGCGGCVVSEIDSKGNVVNATCTDERGRFRLRVMDPNGLIIKAELSRYDQEWGKFVKYKPYVKKIADKRTDVDFDRERYGCWYDVSELQHYLNLGNAKAARRPRSSRQKIIVAGHKPGTGYAVDDEYVEDEVNGVDGVVMNAIGPLKDAVITERDLNGKIISETKTGANGEFRLESVNPDNYLYITCNGYKEIRHSIDGNRFIVTMKKK